MKKSQGTKTTTKQVGKKTNKEVANKEVTNKEVANKQETVKKTVEKPFYYMNVAYQGEEPIIKIGESREGRLTYVDEDNMLFRAKKNQPEVHKELCFKFLDRTLHGKLSINAYGLTMHFYVQHSECMDEYELSDLLGKEAEDLTNAIADFNIREEVKKIQALGTSAKKSNLKATKK